jgi:hypothetical protein
MLLKDNAENIEIQRTCDRCAMNVEHRDKSDTTNCIGINGSISE